MVSRQHCQLRVGEGGVFLTDLGSRHGTLVNGTLINRETRLQQGDQIQIGPLVFELQLETISGAVPVSVSLSPPPGTTPPLADDVQGLMPPDSSEETAQELPSLEDKPPQ
jgi:pSer/pThr/pTyr-binding forkhead associated (FHA) protein